MGRIFCRLDDWLFGPTGSLLVYIILFTTMGKRGLSKVVSMQSSAQNNKLRGLIGNHD